MKREATALVLLAGLLGAGWAGYRFLFEADGSDSLTLVQVEGVVRHRTEAGEAQAEQGDLVRVGEGLEAGPDGAAVLSFGPETRVSLKADSSLRVIDVGASGVRLALENGRVQANVREGGAPVAVRSGEREVTARDADVSVAAGRDGTVVVEPSRGEVALSGFDDATTARAGERVVAPSGHAARVVAASQDLLLSLVTSPQGRTRETRVRVAGTTEPAAQVRIEGGATPVVTQADAEGAFAADVPLAEGQNVLTIVSTNALGVTARTVARVERDTTAPGIQVEIR